MSLLDTTCGWKHDKYWRVIAVEPLVRRTYLFALSKVLEVTGQFGLQFIIAYDSHSISKLDFYDQKGQAPYFTHIS